MSSEHPARAASERSMSAVPYAAGAEVANVGTIRIVTPGGAVMLVDGVFTYRVDTAGKVTALRAYWELARMKAF